MARGQQRDHGPGAGGQGRRAGNDPQQLAAGQPPRGHDRARDPPFPRVPGRRGRSGAHGAAVRGRAHRYLARAPGQRAAAAGRHRRPPAPPRAGGPGRLRPGRDRLPHGGLPGRPGPEPRRVPARHAARAQCGRHAARRQCGRRAHPGAGENRNRRRPARRRRRRFPQRGPAHPRGPRPAGRLPLRRDRTVHRGRGRVARPYRLPPLPRNPPPPAWSPPSSGRWRAGRPHHPSQPQSPQQRTPYELPDPPPPPAPHHPGHAPADGRTPPRGLGTHPARLHPRRPHRAEPHRLDARRAAAHHGHPEARRRRGRGTRRRRHHALRHPRRPRRRRHRLTGPRRRAEQGHPRRPRRGRGRPRHHERRLPGRIHRPRALRCPRRPRLRGQRRHTRDLRPDGRGPGGGRAPTCSARPE